MKWVLKYSLMTVCHYIIIITLLRKNRDVCLIETINHITTNNCYCFSFWPWKHFCLSCFVGYRRSILYTFEISFHRFHSSFIFLMCPHLMCFSPIQKYLISCFHILKISCTTQLEKYGYFEEELDPYCSPGDLCYLQVCVEICELWGWLRTAPALSTWWAGCYRTPAQK